MPDPKSGWAQRQDVLVRLINPNPLHSCLLASAFQTRDIVEVLPVEVPKIGRSRCRGAHPTCTRRPAIKDAAAPVQIHLVLAHAPRLAERRKRP
ncbi:MAG: hypothetical protein EpisKO_30440 [Epibacterium sp.]